MVCEWLHVHLPLRLGDMRVEDCRFFDSKMRPLLLVYDNPDTSSVLKDVRIMFKNGDGKHYMYLDTGF